MNGRTRTIEARVSAEEKAALVAVADYHRRRPSETLRYLVRSEAERLGLWDDIASKARKAAHGTR